MLKEHPEHIDTIVDWIKDELGNDNNKISII